MGQTANDTSHLRSKTRRNLADGSSCATQATAASKTRMKRNVSGSARTVQPSAKMGVTLGELETAVKEVRHMVF